MKGLTPEELEALAPETKQAIYDYAKSDSESESDSRTQSQTHNIEPDEYKSEKFDEIINKYELEIKNFYVNNPNNEQSELNAIIFRLKSQNPGVINTALKHS